MSEALYTTDKEKALVRFLFEKDFFSFACYFFKVLRGEEFKSNWHHRWICSILEKIYTGELQNVIINISPGSSKSCIVSILFPAWCYFKDPHCRFLLTSYSDELVEANSVSVKDVIRSKEFQELRGGYSFRQDANKKNEWTLTYGGKNVGEFFAASMKGSLTGRRAGYMEQDHFTGCIIIDDPIKPLDALSDAKRNEINNAIDNTLQSRKAHSKVPILLIMQRLDEEDPTGFLLKYRKSDNWTVIRIPAIIDSAYYEEIPDYIKPQAERFLKESLDTYGEVSYWEYKEPLKQLQYMKQNSPYVFMSQYQQEPTPKGGTLIQTKYFQKVEDFPKFQYIKIFADTAFGVKKYNDNSCFMCVGLANGLMYIIDVLKGRWEAPQLNLVAKEFALKCMNEYRNVPFRGFYIEYKASGQSLLQTLRQETRLPIMDLIPKGDKVKRVEECLPYIESKRVCIPKGAVWVPEFIDECAKFSPLMAHKHDDQVDCLVYAINDSFLQRKEAHIKNVYYG